ncbi:uncharacterized protein LOC131205935 isoform X1 [Anopheles bellator]|uniref:uncharacterized protein LOC131205935 isoform X1 n=1 Tax=Anopheles bellator TaxID=139047 RepID=UPI0026473F59|nr:uncharacterized protein LOC131205935 isoform X1 [Anopheles bellator]
MNLLILAFLAVASLSYFPAPTCGTPAAAGGGHDSKKSVAAAEAVQPINDNGLKEIWQEDDREVLIRNERGTKNNGGGGGAGSATSTGKKERKADKRPASGGHQQQGSAGAGQGPKGQKKVKPTEATRDPAPNSQCRYSKGPWTECDSKTNTRSRTLSLKKGENSCVQTRTIQKKCKKACRYDKGAWSDCDNNGQMSRTDNLKQTSDNTCQATRVVNKNCNQGKSKDKQNKPPKAEKKEKVRRLKRFLKLYNKQRQP